MEQAASPAVTTTMEVPQCQKVKCNMLLDSLSPKERDWLGILTFILTAKFGCFHGDTQRKGAGTTMNWYRE